jgi:hypothetical protein
MMRLVRLLLPAKTLPRLLGPTAAALLASGLIGCGGSGATGTGTSPPPPQTVFYIDCSAATNGTGTQASPWNALASANGFGFQPGDQLLLNRGTTCDGTLSPAGSGSAGSPITIDAYGTGAQPIIDGGTNYAALALENQQYWEINNLEIVGGDKNGVTIYANVDNVNLDHIYLRNLNVHGAHWVPTTRDNSGEVVISSGGLHAVMSDILIDGVTAHDTQASEGISIYAGGSSVNASDQDLGNNITVQNSTAHDVGGDGILVMTASNVLMQNNVTYHTGQCSACTGSTPGALWEWFCHTCTVQNNESYSNSTWGQGYDGGDFDIDYYNTNNIVQYNYGHDTAGYCISVFGAENYVDSDNIIRYNVCSNNTQLANSPDPGEILLNTWDGGSIDGLQIYNNTIYWNPVTSGTAIVTTWATVTNNSPDLFENNIIYGAAPGMITSGAPFTFSNNIYWMTGSGSPSWQFNGTTYTDFASYQSGTGQETGSLYTDPLLNNPTYDSTGMPTSAFTLQEGSPAIGAGTNVCSGQSGCSMGTQDFFGNPLSSGSGYNIGAYQGP